MWEQLSERAAGLPGVRACNDLDSLRGTRFDKISCLEVLEHLHPEGQEALLSSLRSLVADDGIVVISVPIETGVSSLLKNLIRMLHKETHPNTDLRTVTRALFGMRIERDASTPHAAHDPSYILTHSGFNHRDVARAFGPSGFRTARVLYSPLPFMRSWLNSQVFYILRPDWSDVRSP
jgi:hypothetical protein